MLKETVQKQMIYAMKSGNKDRKQALSNIKAALTNKEIELRGKGEMNEVAEIEAITKLVKQVKESIETCPKDRVETLNALKNELAVYEEFMPDQMSEDEIKDTLMKVIDKLGIAGTAAAKNKSMIMMTLMPMVKGKADGKLVNKIVTDYLHKN